MPALECECVQATVPAVEFSSPESPVLLCSPGFLCFSVISHQSSVISGQWSVVCEVPFFWGGGSTRNEGCCSQNRQACGQMPCGVADWWRPADAERAS